MKLKVGFLLCPLLAAACVGLSPASSVQKPAKKEVKPTAAIQKRIDSIRDSALQPNDKVQRFEQIAVAAHKAKDVDGEAWALAWSGSGLRSAGRRQEALVRYGKAEPLFGQAGDLEGQAAMLNNRAEILKTSGQIQKALALFRQALPLVRRARIREGEACALGNIGSTYQDLGRFHLALQFFLQAIDIQLADKDLVGAAFSSNNIGSVSFRLGYSKQALTSFDQALRIFHNEERFAEEAITRNNIGSIHDALGQKQEALQWYREALALSAKAGAPQAQAVSQANIGSVYDDLGQMAPALESYRQALTLFAECSDFAGVIKTLNNIGSLYLDLGLGERALEFFKRTLNAARKVCDPAAEAVALNNIGSVWNERGQKQKALECCLKALKIRQAIDDRASEGTSMGNVGSLWNSLGKPQKAVEYCEMAGRIAREVGDRSGEAAALRHLGDVWNGLGKRTQALEAFEKAQAIRRGLGDRNGEALLLGLQAKSLRNLSLRPLAVAKLKQAVGLLQSLREDNKGLKRELRDSFRGTFVGTYHLLIDWLCEDGRVAEALQVLELLKDKEYDKATGSKTLRQIGLTPSEKEWQDRYDALAEALAKLAGEFDPLDRRKKAGDTLTPEEAAKLKDIGPTLEAARKAFGAFLEESRKSFKLKEADEAFIRELESKNELARKIAGLPGKPAAVLTLVTPDGIRTILALPGSEKLATRKAKIDAAELDKKVRAFQFALANPDVDPIPLASELYELVVRPIEGDLKASGAKQILWSFDGSLRYIPVWALYDKVEKKYLVDKYEGSLFVPARVDRLAESNADRKGGYGFGTTKACTVKTALDAVSFPALKGVKEELKGMTDATGGQARLDEQFDEKAIKNCLSDRPRFVHVASHFFLAKGDPEGSFLLLGDGKPLSLVTFQDSIKNSLGGVELVLSACNTATPVGPYDGSEYESLARVALENGASSVIATLWSVSDGSTGLLMGKYYGLRKADPSLGRLEALRRAALWLRGAEKADLGDCGMRTVSGIGSSPALDPAHPCAHPYYWAPFVLTGATL